MIRNIQRRWFEVWADEEAQNHFLKYLLLIFCVVAVAELGAVCWLAGKRPIIIAVGHERTQWNISEQPDGDLLKRELIRVLQEYLRRRYNWDWSAAESQIKSAAAFVAPEFKEKFLMSVLEQARIAKEKQVSEKLYPDEPQIDLKERKAKVSAERILIVNGLRASQPMNFELDFDFGDRTETNPEGIYLTNEKVQN